MRRMIFLLATIATGICSCTSEDNDVQPQVQRKVEPVKEEVIAPTSKAYYQIYNEDKYFSLIVYAEDTVTFTAFVQNTVKLGEYKLANDHSDGSFENSVFIKNGVMRQAFEKSGTVSITKFDGDVIEFNYDITYNDGSKLKRSYSGAIKKLQ